MNGPGSAGNVIAALASFFYAGLGQLVQGRLLMAQIHFVLASILWIFMLGWIIHLWSILDAALYESPKPYWWESDRSRSGLHRRGLGRR